MDLPEPTSTLPDEKTFAELVHSACFAADDAVMSKPGRTRAQDTRNAVDAALRLLFDNGLIVTAPRSEWPEWLRMDHWKEIASR